jgi:hypothetical protein
MTWCRGGKRVRAAKAGVQALVVVRCHLQWKSSYYEEFIEKVVYSYVAFGWCLDEHAAVVLCLDVCRGFICRYSPVGQRKTHILCWLQPSGLVQWWRSKLAGCLRNTSLESQLACRLFYPVFPQPLQPEQKTANATCQILTNSPPMIIASSHSTVV